jgi:hypothetical protein
MSERNTWRSDEKPETKVFFLHCGFCEWDSPESFGEPEEADGSKSHCPECKNDDLTVRSAWI